jgi:hypothetical protein
VKKQLFILILLFSVFFEFSAAQNAEKRKIPEGGALLRIEIEKSGDTLFIAPIQDLRIYPRQSYSVTKTEEQFYWKTVRDIKKTLPLAKTVSAEIAKTNRVLVTLKSDRERKDYLDAFEKQIINQYEPTVRNMTRSQGKMLIKLIDRECQISSYDLIRIYKGGFSAFFWQGIAKLFKTDLKDSYDPTGEDKQLERIIELVEAGQL